MRRLFGLILTILLILIGVSFSYLNSQQVTINLFVANYHLALSLLLTVTLVIGILFGVVLTSIKFFRLRRELKKLKHRLLVTEKEISNLRTIPVKDLP